jgi:large subunit ribosomal protein L25
MEADKLNAMPRNEKGYKVRREQFVPGILYGKNIESTSVKFDKNEIDHTIRKYGDRARLKVVYEEKESLGIFKEVARDVLTREVLHLDIQIVSLDEEISLNVPIILNGADAIAFKKLVLQQSMTEIQLTGRVDHIPNSIEIDVSNMEDGDTITLADIEIPEGITYSEPEDTLIAAVREPKMLDLDEEEAEETEDTEDVEGTEDAEEAETAETEE